MDSLASPTICDRNGHSTQGAELCLSDKKLWLMHSHRQTIAPVCCHSIVAMAEQRYSVDVVDVPVFVLSYYLAAGTHAPPLPAPVPFCG